jgi:hypothetical protein
MTALFEGQPRQGTKFTLFNMQGTLVGKLYRTWAVQCCTAYSQSLPGILRMAGLDSYLEY